MIKPIRAIIRMLQGKVILEDTTDVRIVKREYPMDKTPCITIDNSGGTAVIQKNITNKEIIIPTNHPQYDPNNPNQTISQQVIREERNITLDLNVWCDTEDERDEITNKISELFYQVQSDHYTFCDNYNNGNCSYLNGSCRVDNTTFRGVKGQCPKPQEYHYKNIFTIFDIIRATFDVAPPFILDDLTTTPPTLRSIIRVSFSYYDYHFIGGAVSKKITAAEDLLESGYFRLSDILRDNLYFVGDIIYEDSTIKYISEPITDVHSLKDLSGAVKNLEYTSEKDIQFDRFESDSTKSIIDKSEVESLNGLLVGLKYENGVILYAQMITQ